MVGMTLNLIIFFARESCGWCTPCREGLQWTAALLEDIEYGRGRPGDIEVLAEGAWFMGPEQCFSTSRRARRSRSRARCACSRRTSRVM